MCSCDVVIHARLFPVIVIHHRSSSCCVFPRCCRHRQLRFTVAICCLSGQRQVCQQILPHVDIDMVPVEHPPARRRKKKWPLAKKKTTDAASSDGPAMKRQKTGDSIVDCRAENQWRESPPDAQSWWDAEDGGDLDEVLAVPSGVSNGASSSSADGKDAVCRTCKRRCMFSELSKQGTAKVPSYVCLDCRKAETAYNSMIKSQGAEAEERHKALKKSDPEKVRKNVLKISAGGDGKARRQVSDHTG